MCLKADLDEVGVCTEDEIVRLFQLVHKVDAVFFQVLSNCFCGNGQVVVGDFVKNK